MSEDEEFQKQLYKAKYAHSYLISKSIQAGKMRVSQRSDNLYLLQVNVGGAWIAIESVDLTSIVKTLNTIMEEETVEPVHDNVIKFNVGKGNSLE